MTFGYGFEVARLRFFLKLLDYRPGNFILHSFRQLAQSLNKFFEQLCHRRLTDSIDYVATDQSGLTSTSTRTVIIELAAGKVLLTLLRRYCGRNSFSFKAFLRDTAASTRSLPRGSGLACAYCSLKTTAPLRSRSN